MRTLMLIASLCLLCALSREVQGESVTFDSLPPDFAPVSSYTENNITFLPVNGASSFYPGTNPSNGTTGAYFFSSDGSPYRITFSGGTPFTLINLEIFDIDVGSNPILFTSSTGAVQSISTTGLFTFGSGFSNVTFVQFDIPEPLLDRYIGLDNITVSTQPQAVPEPTTVALLGSGLAGLTFAIRRRRKAQST